MCRRVTDEAGSDHDNLLVVRSLWEAQRESEESSARSVRVSCRSINRLARKAKSDVQSRRPYPICRGFIIAFHTSTGEDSSRTDNGQVIWLPDQPTSHAFPRVSVAAVADVAFVPGYSGGTATDLHRFPSSSDLDLVELPDSLGFRERSPRRDELGLGIEKVSGTENGFLRPICPK